MKTPPLNRLACIALLGAAAALPCQADSIASSASSAGSASLGSLSDSVHGSSTSSSGDKKVADGDYQVRAIAALADRPGMLRLTLQAPGAEGDAGAFLLDLPQKALGAQGIAAGELVAVHHRPYGLAFARGPAHEAFFLVLDDDWHSDLDARALTL